ncbi:MAG TPA: acyl-CoA dehydrogenase family protein [Spirochaetota bacterium]|nr:acyl-CoA/acyl-ACP dehydrogenase [Spirochaetota bacterium]HOD14489.1 acyl-CoA dehydrogenase family protein [Spirochaetota bacterium]HPG50494.1 acyl-CoA dehydrogenase family protein [Spirochaetota bacterium]HPN11841.1 acyl-CoA dehydrogenase family protein [Spirochaetota bacterium]
MNSINTDSLACERQAFADLAKDFSAKKLAELREEHDRYPFGELFTDAIRDAGIIGLYGINLPVDYGGVGMNAAMVAVIVEKLSEVDASMAGIVFANAAALEIIGEGAAAKNSGDIYTSTDRFGTAPLAFQSFAAPNESDMPDADAGGSLTGTAAYLTLGNIADFAVVPARNSGKQGFSYYLADLKNRNVRISKPVVSLGLHSCPSVDVTFEGIPARLIGMQGEGDRYFNAMRDRMSICAAAMSVGLMKGSFKEALEYAADRYQGGRQIIDWGQVRMMLANMAVLARTGESCLANACRELDDTAPGWEQTATAAAIHLGELANRATTDGVQLLGGNGYMKDYGQEQRMRDARQVQSLLGNALFRKMDFIGHIIGENR